MTPKESARDKRLRKKYAWTLGQIEALARVQDNRCGICGRQAKEMPLNVDHIHFHIEAGREPVYPYVHLGKMRSTVWCAWVREFPDIHTQGITRAEAVAAARQEALPRSVRGLLCPGRHRGCNRLLGRIDNIEWLEKAIEYLKNPPAHKLKQKEINEQFDTIARNIAGIGIQSTES